MNIYLYWIHYPEHTDPLTQGYIGITSDPDRRFKSHQSSSYNRMVKGAIKKGAKMTILHEYDGHETALAIEETYRPDDRIGWNLVKGGGMPPRHQNTPESRRRVSEQFKGKKQTPEHVKKRANALRGSKHSEESKRLMSEKAAKRHVIYVTCLSCKRTMDLANYKKSHGERCGIYQGPAWNRGKQMPTKGKPLSKKPCPHCGKMVDNGNYKRWHGDKCKHK